MLLKFIVFLCGFSTLYAIELQPLEWWQSGVIYQIFPRSFKDSDGDGIGDLKGIEEKAEYFKDLGVSAVWLSPIFESPMIDFGYDVSDFYKIASIFGTIEDFRSLKRKLDTLGIRLLLDLVPNHSSDQCEWFKKSVERIDPYTHYYVWKDPKEWIDGTPQPPNNWVSLFNGPAWKYNEKRKQFYLHQFAEQQPDLNFRCQELYQEMENVIKYWLDEGVDGFRVDSVAYIFEDPTFPDEPRNTNFLSDLQTHESLIHLYSKDWPDNYIIVDHFQKIVDEYSKNDGKIRVVITEAYTDFDNTMKYYRQRSGRGMPFNFLLITDLNGQSKAKDFVAVILKWLNSMPKGHWPNWVIGNHDNSRVATRFGSELTDGMNMLNLLLPGTAFTYNGEEIGMVDTYIRWDQTLDPGAINAGIDKYEKFTRDPERSPFQWNDNINAGFTTNSKPWLPVNPNYWWLNLEAQNKSSRSHYNVYKRLVKLRTHPVFLYGVMNIYALYDWLLAITRSLNGQMFVVLINLGSEIAMVNLDRIPKIPSTMFVHTSSINSEYVTGNVIKVHAANFSMRQKSALILSSEVDKIVSAKKSLSNTSTTLLYYFESLLLLINNLLR